VGDILVYVTFASLMCQIIQSELMIIY